MTSTGFRNPEVLKISLDHLKNQTKPIIVALVVTAAEGKTENLFVLQQKSFIEASSADVRVSLIDTDEPGHDFSTADLIFIAGGNTFRLLSSLRTINFKKSVSECLERGGVVVGASAGAVVLGPNVMIANEVTPDTNELGVTDFQGLKVVNMSVYPHYSVEVEPAIVTFEATYGCSVQRLDNDAFVLFAL